MIRSRPSGRCGKAFGRFSGQTLAARPPANEQTDSPSPCGRGGRGVRSLQPHEPLGIAAGDVSWLGLVTITIAGAG